MHRLLMMIEHSKPKGHGKISARLPRWRNNRYYMKGIPGQSEVSRSLWATPSTCQTAVS